MPKISVIVPIYNAEKYIEKTVETIQNQTIKDIEIILVNDGSTDNSAKICDKLKEKDKRIVVIHQVNKGVSVARNAGIERAQGEYIGFVDSDDFIENDMYEILYENAIENNAELSMVSPVIKDLKGNVKYYYNTQNKYIWSTKEALQQFFKGKVINIAVYTKLIKADICKKLKFEEGKTMHEDKIFTYLAIKNSKKIVWKDECKYHYIKRDNSLSTSEFNHKNFGAIEIAEKIYKDVEKSEYKELLDSAYTDMYITKLLILRKIYRSKVAIKEFSKEKDEIILDIKSINMKKYKKFFSKQKVIEILVIQKWTSLYKFMVKMFDVIFR